MTDTNAERPTGVRYRVVAALCAAATIAYLCRHWAGVAERQIAVDLGLSDQDLGVIMGVFFWPYALLQVPSGLFAQRAGGRRALFCVAVGWSLATAGAGFSVGYGTLLAAVLLAGAAQAGVFPGCVTVVSHWMPVSSRAIACGALGTFMQVGGATAAALTGWLISLEISWRVIVALYAFPGALWAVVFYIWFRDHPSEHPAVNASEASLIEAGQTISGRGDEIDGGDGRVGEGDNGHDGSGDRAASGSPQRPGGAPWKTMLSSVSLWLICGQQFFRAAGYAFFLTWFPRFLKETRGVTTAESGVLASLPVVGFGLGSLAGGAFADWVYRFSGSLRLSRHGLATTCMIASAVLILWAYSATNTLQAMAYITAGATVAGFGGAAGYTITIDLGGKYAAAVFGMMNMSGNFGAALCPYGVAQFVRLTGGSWNWVLLLFVALYMLAALCWFILIFSGGILGPLPARKK